MLLGLEQIKNITLGAVRIEEENDGFHFYRFTAEQEALYKERNQDYYNKTFSTSGIRLSFKTNSKELFIRFFVAPSSSRRYFSLEILKNSERLATVKNFSEDNIPEDYISYPFETGEFSEEINLGEGEKNIDILLPWSMETVISELSLDDNAALIPRKPTLTLLAFGDSITHGYDAFYPSNKYITMLAEHLGAEEYNKAIGGEIFWPELSATEEELNPDIVTVAYGTNDWNRCEKDVFVANCKAFYKNLCEKYSNAKIYAITPIWRKDYRDSRAAGEFSFIEKTIREAVESYGNAEVISGFDFVPKDESFYADKRLHPNDKGYKHYAENLISSF